MPVYLDYNATAPLLPEVLDAMRPFLTERFGNASSLHSFGRAARDAIEAARTQVAYAVDAAPDEIIFTGGATESNNFFLKNFRGKSLLISEIEHPAVLQPAWQMAGWQTDLHFVAPNVSGEITAQAVQIALSQNTAEGVAIMAANNETGAINDILAIAKALQAIDSKIIFHTDAVQAFGKIPLSFNDFKKAGGATMALSSHKLGGPQGVGAFVFKRSLDFNPLLAGGGQEQGLRSGTENVAGIVGFGMAAALAAARQKEYARHTQALKNQLEAGLKQLGATIFAENAERLPNTTYFAFPNIDGATLVAQLDALGFAVGSGSACGSGKTRASVVLKAMQTEPTLAQGAVRVSTSRPITTENITAFLGALNKVIERLKKLSAF